MPSEANRPGYGNLRLKTIDELWHEYHYWNDKITNSVGWGAALAAANEFRIEIIHELRRRDEQNVPKESPFG